MAALSVITGRDGGDFGRTRRLGAARFEQAVRREITRRGGQILAQTGGPRRFATARALVKHAGLAPREKLSGAFTGRTRLTGQGRPGCAWQPGARSGERSAPTPSTGPATST